MVEVNSGSTRSFCGALLRRTSISCCLALPPAIVHDPDPSTYDQLLVLSTGGAPSFDSPDIETVDIWPMKPIPNLTATVRNLSYDSSANQTRVDLSWSQWGIGMSREPIATSFVDLGRAGFPGSEQTLSWPLPPALEAAGRFGIFVSVIHPFDTNPNNNRGEQTVDGFQTSTGRSKVFVLPVRNPSGSTQTINLSVGPASVADWVTVIPSTMTLGGNAVSKVMISINVPGSIPASPAGTEISATVDVLATINGTYLGGASFVILLDA
jgi:hypothetical protein